MKSKKWSFNILLSVCLLTLLTILCGFSGEGINCSNDEHYLDYTLGVGDGYSYHAYESGDGAGQTLTVYVPLNQETQIPLKAVLTPAEGHSLQDFGGEDSGWTFVAEASMPDGLSLGESNRQEIEGSLVVTATVTVSSQNNQKIFDSTTIRLKNQKDIALSADSVQLNIIAMNTSCTLCGGLLQPNGTYTHNTCGVCGSSCDGTTYEHKSCVLCGGLCDGTAYVHKTCGVCGSSCNGTAYVHKTCGVCGGLCDGTAYAHKACDICGGLCDGTAYAHKTCDICGGSCDGTAYVHKTCGVCGSSCDGTAYVHKTCVVCGGLCDGTAYAHKACDICGGLCDGTAYAHKTCEVCGVLCNGTTYEHKAGFSCSDKSGGTTSNEATTEGQTTNVTTSNHTEGDNSVATGDSAPIALYGVLTILSGLIIALLILFKNKSLRE